MTGISRIGITLLLAAALLLSSCGGGGSSFQDDGSPAGMLTRINAVRTGSGNAALSSDAALQAVAQAHADYMAGITQLKPTDAAGTDLLVLVQNAGFAGNGRILANGESEADVFGRLQANSANAAVFNGAAFTVTGIGYATSSTSQWWCIVVSEGPNP